MRIVNKEIPKTDGMGLVKGRPVYTDDLAPQGALVVKVLRSPHAFARIKKIDTAIALKVPGVECVLTYKDLKRIPMTRAGQCYPELSAYDKFILDEYVRHIGDDVAIIAATTEQAASKAMPLVKVDYEVLEPLLDFEEAAYNEQVIHPEEGIFAHIPVGFEPQNNIACQVEANLGDVEETLAACDVVMTRTYQTQAQAQAMMETQRTYSYLDHQGRLVVVSSTQIPYHVRRHLGRVLEMPMSKIRVIKPRVGGGFGAKQTAHSEFYPALVTMKTGKPAKIVYSRKETFDGTTSRHAMRFNVTLGANKDGWIKAIILDGLSDTGAYGEHAQTTFGAAGKKVLTLYNKVEACRFTGKAVYTNHVPGGALRGFGVTQGTFAIETAMNELGDMLGIDAVKMREMNMIKKGETTPLINMFTKDAGKEPIYMDSCLLEQCVEKGKELIKWQDKSIEIPTPHVKRGKGMAISQQGSGLPNIDMASATLKLNDDGFFNLLTGATDIGTGSDTILAQMAAEILEVDVDQIVVYASDTDVTPYDSGAYASSTTYTSGNAVINAAEKMHALIREYGAKFFNVTMEEINFKEGTLFNKSDGMSVPLQEFAQKITYNMIHTQLSTTGSFVPKKAAPPYMAGFTEVEVDMQTGEVEVLDFYGVIDCGTPINPQLAKIQAEGGIAQGIGFALLEDVAYDPKGKHQTNSFMQYKIPCRKDVGQIHVAFADGYDETGPFGAKSIGEVVINTAAPAIIEAIYQACGVRIRELPATPEKILKGLNALKQQDDETNNKQVC